MFAKDTTGPFLNFEFWLLDFWRNCTFSIHLLSPVALSMVYIQSGVMQMPVVMAPVHFDRDPTERKASTLRSFVLRPFITSDFMTGVAALPGRDIPEKVCPHSVLQLKSSLVVAGVKC